MKSGERPDPTDWISRVDKSMQELLLRELAAIVAASIHASQQTQDPAGSGIPNDLPPIVDEAPTLTVEESQSTRISPTPGGLLHPEVIGDHRIIEPIGVGGMGIVYKARHNQLQRIVALKTFHAGLVATPVEIARFRAEAGAAARLHHPGIVPVYEFGADRGLHFYTMLYVEGKTLQQLLQQDNLLAPRKSAELIMRAAQALDFAHASGVIHRDIKPSNIIIDTEGCPRITDFGLAKLQFEGSTPTRTGMVMGTPAYMSPEQALGRAAEAGPESDVYGLGAVLYQCITGRPPFQGGVDDNVRRLVIHEDPIRPRLLTRTVPIDLETICLKCLEKKPESRYRTAGQLAEDLQRFLQHQPILARRIGRAQRAVRSCRRKPLLAAAWMLAIALFLMLTTGIPLLLLLRQQVVTTETLRRQALEVAETNERLAATQTYYAAIREVRESGMSPVPGWSWKALDRLREACHSEADERDPTELRSLITGCLMATDAQLMATFAENEFIRRMAFSRDGSLLVTGDVYKSPELTVTVYHLMLKADDFGKQQLTMTPIRRLKVPSQWNEIQHWMWGGEAGYFMPGIDSLAFSPDGNRLAVGNRAGKIFIWDLQSDSASPALKILTEQAFVVALTWADDGQSLYGIATAKERLHRWDATTGGVLSVAETPSPKMSLHPGNPQTMKPPAVVYGHSLVLLDPESLQQVRLLHPQASTWPHAIDPNGHVLAAMHLWTINTVDLCTGRIGRPMREPHGVSVDNYWRACFANNGGILAGSVTFGLVRLWDALSGSVLLDINIDVRDEIYLELHDATRLMMVAIDAYVQAFRLRMPGTMKHQDSRPLTADRGSDQHIQRIVDGVDASPIEVLPLGVDDVTRFVVSRDGRWLATSEASVHDPWLIRRNQLDTQVFRIRQLERDTGDEVHRWVFRSMKPTYYPPQYEANGLSFVDHPAKHSDGGDSPVTIAAAVEIPGDLMLLDPTGIQFRTVLNWRSFRSGVSDSDNGNGIELTFPQIPDPSGRQVLVPSSEAELPIAASYRITVLLHASRAPHSDDETFSIELDLAGEKQVFEVNGSVLESRGWHLLQLDVRSVSDCRQSGNSIVLRSHTDRVTLLRIDEQQRAGRLTADYRELAKSPLQVLVDRLELTPLDDRRKPIHSAGFVNSYADGSISAVASGSYLIKWAADGTRVIDRWFDLFNNTPVFRTNAVGSEKSVLGVWNGHIFLQHGDALPIRILGEIMAPPGATGDEALAMAVTPDDRFAVAGCRSGTVRVFV